VWLHDRFEENEDYAGIVVSVYNLRSLSSVDWHLDVFIYIVMGIQFLITLLIFKTGQLLFFSFH